MRPSVSAVLSLLLLGGCLPDDREAAVGLEVIYKARPGCIIVLARDAKEPHGEASVHLDGDKLDNTRARIAIFRQKSWSHTLEIITTAHEQSCEGAVVAQDERQIQLKGSGVESLSVTLGVTDEDGDGYMPVSLDGSPGGTDCDDGQPNTHPHATEVCDHQDNDCDGSPDNGLSTQPWYVDQDGDGFGGRQASPVERCKAPAGSPAYVSDNTDCDDQRRGTHPGAIEVCDDDRDNDCDGSVDEDVFAWYPDRDGDGFGDMLAAPVMRCAAPAGPVAYVQDATDCLDSDPLVHPRPGASEMKCDDVDDDCDGVVDDGFAGKGTMCSEPCGRLRCNPSGNGLFCDAPAKVPVFQDKDADGAGDETGPSVEEVCPNEDPPSGTVFNMYDCDDLDPHNRRGGAEVCDDRDNTCDGQRDEGNVCNGKGWARVDDQVLKSNRNWRTVALRPGGRSVWVAGLGGVLAVRHNPGESFVSRDGACGLLNWRAAWVRPSDGHVFLAGEGGYLAEHDGARCSNADRVASQNTLTGLIGFESNEGTLLYVVDDKGQLYAWRPGHSLVEHYNMNPPTHFGIHGVQSNRLLVVGGASETNQAPHIISYTGSGGAGAVRTHTLQGIPGNYAGAVRAVWMAQSGLAYAVGDSGLVMRWDGAEAWDFVSPPANTPTADFTSVVVLDASSIYVTDTSGSIRRLTASGWAAPPFYDTDRALRDIALHSPEDIWAVGDDGRVIHFPQ